jgi:hypothetical protein
MKISRLFALLLCALLMSGCGLIYGQLTKVGDGIKSFAVIQGDLAGVKGGGDLLVYAPFAKTDQAFYVARGDDASRFAISLKETGLFRTEFLFEHDLDDVEKTAKNLRGMTAAEVQSFAAMQHAPRMILFGTLLKRSESVAPTRGVLMDTTYRLEFFDVSTRKSIIIEVQVRDLAENCVGVVVRDLKARL